VRDSFEAFVAAAEGRVKEAEGGSRRIRFGSGRGYSPATGETSATGSVSLHVEAGTVVRKILREEPAISFEDYDLTFEYRNDSWEFKKGTLRRRLTEAFITSGRRANEIDPERTVPVDFQTNETLQFLFHGKGRPQEKRDEKKERTEEVRLLYLPATFRVIKDRRFVAIRDKGISSAPLQVVWDLPKNQDKEKREFDDLIERLERQNVKGVEFECKGEWLVNGFTLRLTTVPQPTREGKQRIERGAQEDRKE
jgi:hypothetical protein